MRLDRQRMLIAKGQGDECLGGEQSFRLNRDAGQSTLQLGCGARGMGVGPATDKAKFGPDRFQSRRIRGFQFATSTFAAIESELSEQPAPIPNERLEQE